MKERTVWIKRIAAGAILLAFAILAALSIFIVGEVLRIRSEAVQDQWGLGLPDGLECVYHEQEESFHGDGWHYEVYKMQPGDIWLEDLNTEADSEVEAFYDSAVEKLHVEREYYSHLRGTKYWWRQQESDDGLRRAVAVYDIGRGYLYVAAWRA